MRVSLILSRAWTARWNYRVCDLRAMSKIQSAKNISRILHRPSKKNSQSSQKCDIRKSRKSRPVKNPKSGLEKARIVLDNAQRKSNYLRAKLQSPDTLGYPNFKPNYRGKENKTEEGIEVLRDSTYGIDVWEKSKSSFTYMKDVSRQSI